MFGFKKKTYAELVKVVYVPTPKHDFGTRLKSLDFDPVSMIIGAAIPTTIAGGFMGTKLIQKARLESLMFKAIRNEVCVSNSFSEYSENVRDYVIDHPLVEGLSTADKVSMAERLLIKLDRYYSKHGVDNACTCGCEDDDSDDEFEDDVEEVTEPVATPSNPSAEPPAPDETKA